MVAVMSQARGFHVGPNPSSASTLPSVCADGHSFTRGGCVAVQQDGLLRVQVHQRARRVA